MRRHQFAHVAHAHDRSAGQTSFIPASAHAQAGAPEAIKKSVKSAIEKQLPKTKAAYKKITGVDTYFNVDWSTFVSPADVKAMVARLDGKRPPNASPKTVFLRSGQIGRQREASESRSSTSVCPRSHRRPLRRRARRQRAVLGRAPVAPQFRRLSARRLTRPPRISPSSAPT